MPIETVRRFYCPRCQYMTYDESQIEWIKKLGGKCPACNNGKHSHWEKKYDTLRKPTIVSFESKRGSGMTSLGVYEAVKQMNGGEDSVTKSSRECMEKAEKLQFGR